MAGKDRVFALGTQGCLALSQARPVAEGKKTAGDGGTRKRELSGRGAFSYRGHQKPLFPDRRPEEKGTEKAKGGFRPEGRGRPYPTSRLMEASKEIALSSVSCRSSQGDRRGAWTRGKNSFGKKKKGFCRIIGHPWGSRYFQLDLGGADGDKEKPEKAAYKRRGDGAEGGK